MKKIALTSVLAVFAVAGSANAANEWFVGGAAGIATGKDTGTVYGIAPELGYHLNSKWDLGLGMGYAKTTTNEINGQPVFGEVNVRDITVAPFVRYNVAQFGNVNLLIKGSAGVGFENFYITDVSETETRLFLDVIPMITYDLSESFTLYANLNFLGLHAAKTFENKDIPGSVDGWNAGLFVDATNVANTADFQVGFTYNF